MIGDEKMKEKIKEFMKKYLIGFVLGVISAAVVVVYAETYYPSNQVTYDNTESGMTSDNVQGAIDELYNTCFPPTAGNQIIENAGLEKDPYECRYFFTGANPNNYITFNNEDAGWRIVSVECDGTIKIMGNLMSGSAQSTPSNWTNFYKDFYYHYDELTDKSKRQVIDYNFSMGAVTWNNNDLADQVNDENSMTWNGKIALPTVSEYLRTNSNTSCKTLKSYNNNYTTCKNTTWMYVEDVWWTLSPYSDYLSYAFYVDFGTINYGRANPNYLVYPVFYLSSDIKITGGDGSQSNPYKIE